MIEGNVDRSDSSLEKVLHAAIDLPSHVAPPHPIIFIRYIVTLLRLLCVVIGTLYPYGEDIARQFKHIYLVIEGNVDRSDSSLENVSDAAIDLPGHVAPPRPIIIRRHIVTPLMILCVVTGTLYPY